MNTYKPDAWVLVDLIANGETIRKVFAGWLGGYAGSDSWKLSSETIMVNDRGDHYEFHQYSGSIYYCYKSCNYMSSYMRQVLEGWQVSAAEVGNYSIEVVKYD